MHKSILVITILILSILSFKTSFCADASLSDTSNLSIKDLFTVSAGLEGCSYVSDVVLTNIANSNRIEKINAFLLKGNLVQNCINWEKLEPCTFKKEPHPIDQSSVAKVNIPEDGVYTIVKVSTNTDSSNEATMYNDNINIDSISSINIDLIKTSWLEKGDRSILISENLVFHYECSLGQKDE